jgi:hypothetical protein
MNIDEFMSDHGENFRLERGGELFVVEGIKTRGSKELKFRPRTDVRTGDWLSDDSGRRFYVLDTDVQRGFEREPFALIASYQTEAEHEATRTQRQAPPTSVTFNVGNAYGSIFGTQQHAEMNDVSFDFSTVEAELDRAEEEIARRGGPDEAELRELIAEVRALHESGEPLDRGRLARFLGVIQDNGWIAGPIAGTLLSIVTGA